MSDHAVHAEWEPLESVRVHTPGLELWSGSLAPEPNLFEGHVPPDRAAREHDRIVDVLRDAGVEVHQLADDLAAAGVLDDLAREALSRDACRDGSGTSGRAGSDGSGTTEGTGSDGIDVDGVVASFDAREKLQTVLARPSVVSAEESGASIELDRPISNVYFQRDTTILADRGPILCEMHEPIRRRETPLVRDAWSGVGAGIAHEMSGEPIEGGEFMPAGEFALLGVSADLDGEEHVIRTSYAAGEQLMDVGAVGYPEFGLVRAPLEADRRLRGDRGLGSRVMHLLGWFNVAAEGLAVLDADLARAAEVDVYRRRGDGYAYDRSTSTLEYVRDDRGFDVIDVAPTERWPTNFLAIDDGVVVPLYEPDANGEYRPENNPTIEALKRRGVRVLPDGEGVPRDALTEGAGGIHCMTTPIVRG